ncbi:MAG: amino acid--tRNA ligase-related protein [Bdellovibrionales bacterium]
MESNLNHYKTWLLFLEEVSTYFKEKSFLEVRTPTLVNSGAMESTLNAFKLEGESFYLPTSPEFSLKKLWLSGLSKDLFEVSKSFRKGEALGALHLPEFTMLEFYMAEKTFKGLKAETEDFFKSVFGEVVVKAVHLDEAFASFTGFKLKPDSDKAFLKKVMDFHGLNYAEDYSWNDLYQVIYLNLIEPLLCKDSLLFLENYPPQLSALAKVSEKGWALRLEIFYKGIELGNGYDELFCEKEIKSRWLKENAEREGMGLEKHPVDVELLQLSRETELKQGVGIAIGLERVFSLLFKSGKSIKVWPF